MTLEQTVEYFSIFGGVESLINLDFFDTTFSMVKANFVEQYHEAQSLVNPGYLLETPYLELLTAVARGDGKEYAVYRKVKLSESVGERLVSELVDLGVLVIEKSRENPLRIHPKQKLKKHLRAYRIQNKLRFTQPFLRFWFGFVAPYSPALQKGKGEAFLENFEKNYERLRTLVYEQLSDQLLKQYYEMKNQKIVSSGSYWDQYTEFDILSVTKEKKVILGECKYKDRKVCKNEFTKLTQKAEQSGIPVDTYALFAKSGFSNELLQQQSDTLLLFDLNDLKMLLE